MFVCRHSPEKMDVHSYVVTATGDTTVVVTCNYCGEQRYYLWESKAVEAAA